ncbi:MAG: 1-hydroxycarotenoid 3,4-desaturase CrtD [Roseinatronobacter sp.]
MTTQKDSVIVIGAGMGGLAAAIRLAAAGRAVTLLEAQSWPGGKMRTMPSAAGPVDAGPTVLTMRDVLEDLFQAAGTDLSAHVTLCPLPILARHFWSDGTQLDLFPDKDANADAVGIAFGTKARTEFLRFDAETRSLFSVFDAPIMRSPRPAPWHATRALLRHPELLPWLGPRKTLTGMLRARFSDPRLRQLFGRYATYVGGNPLLAPAILGLIWQAEARGVWAVEGGMASLAQALADLFVRLGGRLRFNTPVAQIHSSMGEISAVTLKDGERMTAGQIVFNGDPAALPFLLDPAQQAPGSKATEPRSLSAHVWTFAATLAPRDAATLAYHSVFFAESATEEFAPLARGEIPTAPTIYVCAQDRIHAVPTGQERFQFILNAPAIAPPTLNPKDAKCQIHPFTRLAQFGLQLSPTPGPDALTRPQDFARLFPHSAGALYGLSPNGMMATFLRPTARARLKGLYLAGGGVHPGAGVPMALLSGKHAATAALNDRTSEPMLRPTATHGGTSTGSAMTARAPSR